LIKCGAVNYVVVPRPLENQRSEHQKTDRLDARALLVNLESYLRGNRNAMSIVAVPSPEQEQQRSVVRYREQLMRNRRRAEARGRALALTSHHSSITRSSAQSGRQVVAFRHYVLDDDFAPVRLYPVCDSNCSSLTECVIHVGGFNHSGWEQKPIDGQEILEPAGVIKVDAIFHFTRS
jgi:hypothetical protein